MGLEVSIHFASCPPKRGGLLGTGTRGEEGERVTARPRAPTRKTEEAVDRRHNNQNFNVKAVKAVSPRHSVGTSVPRSRCFNCCAEQSHEDNVRSTAVE